MVQFREHTIQPFLDTFRCIAVDMGASSIRIMVGTMLVSLAFSATNALAFTAPSSGFLIDLYDIFVTQGIQGPGGFVAGVFGMIFAGILLCKQMFLPGAAVVLGAAAILKADALVSSLGAMII